MSSFVDYSKVASTYDGLRHPDGADVEVAMIQLHCNKPLKDIHVLDAGCGTGNYAKKFVEYGIGMVSLLDASEAMLDKAKAKLEIEIKAGKIGSIVQAKLPEIPFEEGTFDAVVFNTVLHHIASHPDGTTFSEIERTVAEGHRVLKPGGLIVIMTLLPSTAKETLWYSNIKRSIAINNAKRYPAIPQFDEIFTKSDFQRLNVMNIFLTEMVDTYYMPEGPLHKEWRDATVFWNEATEEELLYVQNEVSRMKAAGTLQSYMETNDKTKEHGFLTLIFARAL